MYIDDVNKILRKRRIGQNSNQWSKGFNKEKKS